MKQTKLDMWVTAVCAWVLGAVALFAQQPSLTRAQWIKQIGPSVAKQETLRETVAQIQDGDKVEFAQKAIKAAARLPGGPEEKSAALVRTAVGVIAGSKDEVKKQVIAEVFAGTPVDYLPAVTEELAKRFDQEYNKLSNEQYEAIASDTLAMAVKRNAQTDEAAVRNTFVILAFLRGAKDTSLQNKLISQLPDERQRNLAARWVPLALERNYEALLAAANYEPTTIREDTMLSLVGDSNLNALLADLVANKSVQQEMADVTEEGIDVAAQTAWVSLPEIRASGGIVGGALSVEQLNHAPDYGINRVPRAQVEKGHYVCVPCGYQNQGTSVNVSVWVPDASSGRRH